MSAKNMNAAALGLRLKKLRCRGYLDQESIAKLMGISQQTLSLIESGKRNVSVLELLWFCKLYRTSPNELLGWGDPTGFEPEIGEELT